jgi:potassium-transporting ATPase potassium-binding subunit
MTLNGWLQIDVTLALVLLAAIPLGIYMSRVFSGERTSMDPLVRPIERVSIVSLG